MFNPKLKKIRVALAVAASVLFVWTALYAWRRPESPKTGREQIRQAQMTAQDNMASPVIDAVNVPVARTNLIAAYPLMQNASYQEKTPPQSGNILNEYDCKQAGGKWMPQMNVDAPWICRLAASDLGKQCTDSSQCEKYCQARKGTPPGTQAIGKCADFNRDCSQEVRNGIAQFEACQ